MKIEYGTTDEIRGIIDKIGRTEDVKFSPDNSCFVIAEYLAHKLHVFSVEIERSASPTGISITNYTCITSPDINNPHGVCFLGNDRIAVCNRSGDLAIFRLPELDSDTKEIETEAEGRINGKGYLGARVKTPGSVACIPLSENSYRLFVCNNHWHFISSHIIETGDSLKIINEGKLIEHSLQIPDGISLSPDGKWIAVSNHVYGQALVFENSPELNRKTPPSKVFEGLVCPHGIRFSPDGKKLYVADAASQYVYICECENGNWGDAGNSPRAVEMLDDNLFYLGRYGSREGGVKGLDIDNSNSILISTHKLEVIGFYDINALNKINDRVDSIKNSELCRQRDVAFFERDDKRINRKWNLSSRLFQSIRENKYLQPKNYIKRLSDDITMTSLRFANLTSRLSITDPEGPVISLTSHGSRIDTVFYTLESIRQGSLKPARIILWLDIEDKNKRLPNSLERLKRAGLEIYYTENLGPHKKYYPFVQQSDYFKKPLVTADDDIIYPSYWLKKLSAAFSLDPSVIHCFRAHKIMLSNGKFIPYNEWPESNIDIPSHENFITGVSGAIYPPLFLEYLRDAGTGFTGTCPRADDVWLTLNAIRVGMKVAQINPEPKMFRFIPGSQKNGLFLSNVVEGGNHTQLIQTFTDEDMARLEGLLSGEGQISSPSS